MSGKAVFRNSDTGGIQRDIDLVETTDGKLHVGCSDQSAVRMADQFHGRLFDVTAQGDGSSEPTVIKGNTLKWSNGEDVFRAKGGIGKVLLEGVFIDDLAAHRGGSPAP